MVFNFYLAYIFNNKFLIDASPCLKQIANIPKYLMIRRIRSATCPILMDGLETVLKN